MASFLNLTISDTLTQALTYTLIHSLWQSAIVALFMFIAIKKYETKKASTKYNLAFAALILICCSTLFTFIFYLLRGSVDPLGAATAINYPFVIPEISTTTPFATGAQDYSIWTWIDVNNYRIALTWMVGAILFATRLLIGRWHLNKVVSTLDFKIDKRHKDSLNRISKHIGLHQIVRIAISSKVEIPLLVGHLKPIIILPIASINHLSMEETESIIAHELGHVMRNDYLQNLIIVLVESLLFFNPAVWWICNLLKAERENACDDFVLQLFPDRLNYARTLCKLQEMSLKPNTTLSMHLFKNKKSLLKRIQRILNQPVYHSYVREKGWATLLIFLGVFTLTTASEVIVKEDAAEDDNLIEYISIADKCNETLINSTIASETVKDDNIEVIIRSANDPKVKSTIVQKIEKRSNPINTAEVRLSQEDNIFIVKLKDQRIKVSTPNWDRKIAITTGPLSPKIYFVRDTIDEDDMIILTEELRASMAEIKEKSARISDEMKDFEFEFNQEQKEQMKKMEKEMIQLSEQWSQEFQNSEQWRKMEKELSEKFQKNFGPEWQEKMTNLSTQISKEFENSEKWNFKQKELELKLNEIMGPEWEAKIAHLAEDINFRIVDSLDLAWTSTISENISNAMSKLHLDISDHNFSYSFTDGTSDNSNANDRLVNELVKQLNADGLWTTGDNKLVITNDYLKVNNKSLDAIAKDKYTKLIKKYIKAAFDNKTTLKFEMDGKELKEKINKKLSISMDKD